MNNKLIIHFLFYKKYIILFVLLLYMDFNLNFNNIVLIVIVCVVLYVIYSRYNIKEGLTSRSAPKSSSSSTSYNNQSNSYKAGTQIGKAAAKSGSFSCFSKDSLLTLEDGSNIKISDAKVGQKILSCSNNVLKFSSIVSIPHERNNISSQFIKLVTSSGKSIKMTPYHLLPVQNGDLFTLTCANDVEVNDIIMTVDGYESVTSKEIEMDNGIYTVVTNDDYIVVNNIIASPFDTFHDLANVYYQIHRTVYNINPQILETEIFNDFNKLNVNIFNTLCNV